MNKFKLDCQLLSCVLSYSLLNKTLEIDFGVTKISINIFCWKFFMK